MILLAGGAPAWWDPGWAHRSRLSFDNSAASQDLVHFPVLVHLIDGVTFDYALAQPDGADLRFVDQDGVEVPYEIERWTPGADSFLWVDVPRIHGGATDDAIWLYYGNPDAEPVTASPWSDGYLAVFHLDHDGTDSTSFGRDAIDVGTLGVTGVIGRGRGLDGRAHLELVQDPAFDLQELTVSLWVRIPKWKGSFQALVTEGDDGWRLHRCNKGHAVELSVDHGGPNSLCGHQPIDDGSWHLIAGTLSAGDHGAIYVDGEEDAIHLQHDPVDGSEYPVAIGANLEVKGRELVGDVDEVRIDSRTHTADEIHADFLSQTDQLVTWCDQFDGDGDFDGVCDDQDVCPTGNDIADADGDLVPDACDPCPYGADAVDQDGDGACSNVDCDDGDPTRFPGADDPPGDGLDQDCSGEDGPPPPRGAALEARGPVGCGCDLGAGPRWMVAWIAVAARCGRRAPIEHGTESGAVPTRT